MQLLIIDIQNTYRKYCADLIGKIPKYAENFSEVFLLWDDTNGHGFYEEVPDEWMENEKFYDRIKSIEKNYGFFRDLMDLGIDSDDSEIVKLVQFMRKHHVFDVRDINEEEHIKEKFLGEFKNSPLLEINFEDYPLYLPLDLMEALEDNIRDGVVLVGGAESQCLREVSILLRVMEIKHTIDGEYTYA